jgi:predicted nucleic acid-binding protein
MAPREALTAIATYLAMPGITVLPVPVDVVSRWTSLLRRHPVTGQNVFDIQLAATMLGNGVRRIYTWNVRDFRRFRELQVLVP